MNPQLKILATVSYCVAAGTITYVFAKITDRASLVAIFVFFGIPTFLSILDKLSGSDCLGSWYKWWAKQNTWFHLFIISSSALVATNWNTYGKR